MTTLTRDEIIVVLQKLNIPGVTMYQKEGIQQACEIIEREKVVVDNLRYKLLSKEVAIDRYVKLLVAITGFLHPEAIEAPDGKRYEYHPPDAIVFESWKGLSRSLRNAMDELPKAPT